MEEGILKSLEALCESWAGTAHGEELKALVKSFAREFCEIGGQLG